MHGKHGITTGVNGMRELWALLAVLWFVSLCGCIKMEQELKRVSIEMQESRPYAVIGRE